MCISIAKRRNRVPNQSGHECADVEAMGRTQGQPTGVGGRAAGCSRSTLKTSFFGWSSRRALLPLAEVGQGCVAPRVPIASPEKWKVACRGREPWVLAYRQDNFGREKQSETVRRVDRRTDPSAFRRANIIPILRLIRSSKAWTTAFPQTITGRVPLEYGTEPLSERNRILPFMRSLGGRASGDSR